MVRLLTIQPSELPDLTLPYPYIVNLDDGGKVLHQEFWKGKPLQLAGFVHKSNLFNVVLFTSQIKEAKQIHKDMPIINKMTYR